MTDESLGILAVGSAFPRARVSAAELAERFRVPRDQFDERIALIEKPVALEDDEHPSDFAIAAAKKALDALGASPKDVGLVLFTGVSKDYLGSWSVALEVIGKLGLTNAVGWDMALGCAGSIAALEIARTRRSGAPLTLITTAERWTHTISPDIPVPLALVAHADGGAACIVGPGATLRLSPAALSVHPEYNGFVGIPAGGTREPASHETIDAGRHFRTAQTGVDGRTIDRYVEGYQRAIALALKNANHTGPIDLLLTNQVRPVMRARIRQLFDVSEDRTVNTYPRLGHQGAGDVFIGLEHAARESKLVAGVTVLASSANSAFGSMVLKSDRAGGVAI